MKQLMSGNEGIARGAYEAGVTVAAAYPGTPSTEIVNNLADYAGVYAEWSPNEKVALEVAMGASFGGARSLAAMKHVGVNVAADPLFTFAYTGVNGGCVVVSADDPGMHSSQNEQDNRGYGIFAKLPVVEPSDSQEAKDFTRLAFELGERFDTPVMLRVTTRLCHSQSMVELGEVLEQPLKDYKKNSQKYVMLPVHARPRHVAVEKRMAELREYAEDTGLNRIEWGEPGLGVITSGVVYQYLKEVMPQASVLKLGMTNPLPEKMIRDFAARVERLVVLEELEPVIETQIKAWGIAVEGKELFGNIGEYSPEMIETRLLAPDLPQPVVLQREIPPRPPLLCPGCPHRGVFNVLRRMRVAVIGDIGCYTLGALPPLDSMDTMVDMGASISNALGIQKARGEEFARRSIAVIGDSTFIHSGITGLIDIVYNQGQTTVVILDNDTTAMTGHQEHPATGRNIKGEPTPRLDLEGLCRAIGIQHIQVVDPLQLDVLTETIKTELARPEPSVIIARRPCALLVKEPVKARYYVDEDICNGCRLCIRLGCTGIHWKEEEKVAQFNLDNCISCGLCPQVCKFDAIKTVEE
ncbi:MAG: indolepyruvate ferredoxin oxidoreductase subunit alpha [Syntrophomonadaceae bacterium]|nr:indolepyruvate ferredoxin oxidoreductase subunit alpha [Syntrophomonadaceae bacterium]